MLKNVHERLLDHPLESVRPWVERCWSGGDDDVFPRDHIKSWRKNPPGTPATELVPGVTRMGHGPFTFTLREWDGRRWRVDFAGGEHGFDLEPVGARTRIRHTLEGDLGWGFRLIVLPIHDWAVEALFDRLESALADGRVPARTRRPPPRALAFFRGLRRLRRLAQPERVQQAS